MRKVQFRFELQRRSDSALSSPGDHVGSAGPIDTQDSDDTWRGTLCVFREQIILVSFSFLALFLNQIFIEMIMTNDPILYNHSAWTNTGTSSIFSIANVQMFAELLGSLPPQ